MPDDISRQQPPFPGLLHRPIGGAPVHPHPGGGRGFDPQALPQQGADNARQHVAHAGGGHPRIPLVAQEHRPISTGHQRTRALEYAHAAELRGDFAGRRESVGLHLGGGTLQ